MAPPPPPARPPRSPPRGMPAPPPPRGGGAGPPAPGRSGASPCPAMRRRPKPLAQQQAEDRRALHEVASGEAPRLADHPVQPFQPGFPHPVRRPGVRLDQELQRRADAQADAARQPRRRDRRSQPFLPRHAYREHGQPGRVLRREAYRGGEGRRVAVETHRRIMVRDLDRRTAPPQHRQQCRVHADHGQPLPRAQHLGQQCRGEIGAAHHRRCAQAEQARGPCDHGGVHQPQQCRAIDRQQRRIPADPHQVVGVRRDHVAERRVGRAVGEPAGHRGDPGIGEPQAKQRDCRQRCLCRGCLCRGCLCRGCLCRAVMLRRTETRGREVRHASCSVRIVSRYECSATFYSSSFSHHDSFLR